MAIELTPAKLADIKQKAEAAEKRCPSHWTCKRHGFFDYVVSDGEVIARCHYPETRAYIAASDPATVLALVAEIERLRAELKPTCPHWQQEGDGMYEWRRCCNNSSYETSEGGEPGEFCEDCGGKVEILDFDPNSESETGQ